MTQLQLAEAVHISKRAIAAYETENVIARRSTMKRVSAVLNVSIEYLLNDEIISPDYEKVESDYISVINTSVYGQEADKICVLMESVKEIFNSNEINGYNKELIYQAITQEYLMAKADK